MSRFNLFFEKSSLLRALQLLLNVLLLVAVPAHAQQARKPAFQPDQMDTILYGAAYYPE